LLGGAISNEEVPMHVRVAMEVVTVAAVVAALGCGAGSEPPASATRARARVASSTRRRGWSPPSNLGTPVNSGNDEFHPAISADGLAFYFAGSRTPEDASPAPSACDPSSAPPVNYGPGHTDLYVSTRACLDASCPWSTPANLGPQVNGVSDESGPFPSASADGSHVYVYFASASRVGGKGGNDIWRARRGVDAPCWDEAVDLGATINTAANEADPSFTTLDGGTYFFFARGTPYQIYVSAVDPTRLDDGDPSAAFGPPKPVSVSVPGFNNTHPAIFNDTMIFASNRPGTCSQTNLSCTTDAGCPSGETCGLSRGGPDLWMASRSPSDTDGTHWSTPVNLGPEVNTSAIERAPFLWVDPTGDVFLYFASTRPLGYGLGDFYVTRARAASASFGP
jgi:hypothetical protein